MGVIVVLTLAGIVYYVLESFGILSVKMINNQLDISFNEHSPSPAPASMPPTLSTKNHKPRSIELKEVFYVGGNDYTYEEAPALCAAYDADLASYAQVMESYAGGGEWCGYGWTQGGMALFPTQQETWEALQGELDISRKTACGRPGINGGYFDPSTKFGANCYGVKPENTSTKLPKTLPGMDADAFNKMVDKFKAMVTKTVYPFNRDDWSKINLSRQNVNGTKTGVSP
jgi:hypothetical protein